MLRIREPEEDEPVVLWGEEDINYSKVFWDLRNEKTPSIRHDQLPLQNCIVVAPAQQVIVHNVALGSKFSLWIGAATPADRIPDGAEPFYAVLQNETFVQKAGLEVVQFVYEFLFIDLRVNKQVFFRKLLAHNEDDFIHKWNQIRDSLTEEAEKMEGESSDALRLRTLDLSI